MSDLGLSVCCCCERKERGACTGWIVDAEGCDLCPECAYSLTTAYLEAFRDAASAVIVAMMPHLGLMGAPAHDALIRLKAVLDGEI